MTKLCVVVTLNNDENGRTSVEIGLDGWRSVLHSQEQFVTRVYEAPVNKLNAIMLILSRKPAILKLHVSTNGGS